MRMNLGVDTDNKRQDLMVNIYCNVKLTSVWRLTQNTVLFVDQLLRGLQLCLPS